MSQDYYDYLIDQLLRETLGGDRPRDMTARVLARAKTHDRTRRNWWLSTGAAIAAGIAVAVGGWMFWPQQYPKWSGSNVFVYSGNQEVGPGVRVGSPEDSSGSLTLGNYVDMSLAPNTSLTLGGGPRYQERVFLEAGGLNVTTRKRGTFEVVVQGATVQASNSQLDVNVTDDVDDTQGRMVKRMAVKVLEGSAIVNSGTGGPQTINAGNSQTFTISEETTPQFVPGQPSPAPAPTYVPAPQSRGAAGRGVRRSQMSAPAGVEEPRIAQIKVIIGPGPYPLDGILRRLGPYYFLQTPQGNFYMGTREALPSDMPQSGPQSYVHVVFGQGHVKRMDAISALPTQASPVPPSIQTSVN